MDMLTNEMLFLAHIVVVSASVAWGLWYSQVKILAILSLQMVLANFFVTQQIMLFGIETTCSEVFIVGGMYGIGLIRLYHNEYIAQRAIYTIFASLVLFVFIVHFHLGYLGVDPALSGALATISGSSLRLLCASVCAYGISEQVHLFFCSLLDKNNESMVWQVAAVAGGQLVDSVVFGVIGLYGIVDHLVSVVLFSLVVKIIVVLLLSPLIAFTRWCLPSRY